MQGENGCILLFSPDHVMNRMLQPLAFSLILLLSAGTSAIAQMVASNDRVRVEVRASSDTDHKDLKNTTADTITQNKTLTIELSGKARQPETRVIKWIAYGRSMKGNSITELDSGETKLALDPSGKQTVTTKTFSTTYTPEHSVVQRGKGGRGGKGGKGKPRAKEVEAEGKKFAGYAVKVLDGKTVVGEASDPVGIDAKKVE